MLGRKTNNTSSSATTTQRHQQQQQQQQQRTNLLSLSSEDDSSKLKIHNTAPPAPPSISFSDADADEGGGFHSRSAQVLTSIHPYADLDLIAETNSGPTTPVDLDRGPGQAIHHHSHLDADDIDFDPALLNVLSSGESDVHSVLSAPGDLPTHRDPLANLGLTPLHTQRRDKAAQILGIPHRRSMEPLPAHHHLSTSTTNTGKSHRFSSFGSRSATGGYTNPHPTIHESEFRNGGPGGAESIHSLGIPGRNRALSATTTNTGLGIGFGLDVDEQLKTPLSSLYLVAGLPKSHHAWTLADPDSVLGLQHSEGAVNKWWRPEVLGSTVSPGVVPTVAAAAKELEQTGVSKTPIAAANALASSAASIDKKKRRRANTGASVPNALNPRDPGAGIGLSKSQVRLKSSFITHGLILINRSPKCSPRRSNSPLPVKSKSSLRLFNHLARSIRSHSASLRLQIVN
jgi:hypothetical protein